MELDGFRRRLCRVVSDGCTLNAVELKADCVTRHHASDEHCRSAQHDDCELSPTLALLRVAIRLFAAIKW